MNINIEKIYELTNSAILTPQDLVSNIKLKIYQEIRYYTKGERIICELTSSEEVVTVKYLYEFRMDGFLQKAKAIFKDEEMVFFDREQELSNNLKFYEMNRI